jgi:hypothetical protein
MRNAAPIDTCTGPRVTFSIDQLRMAGVSAATPSAAVLPPLAASHEATAVESAAGIGASALRM